MSSTGKLGVSRRWGRRLASRSLALFAAGLLLTACGKAPGPIGELAVRVGGLPEGAGPRISLTDASGVEQPVAPGVEVQLEPGHYTVHAASMTFNGATYAPEESSRVTEVSAGASTVVEFLFLEVANRSDASTDSEATPDRVAGVQTLRGVLWEDRDGDDDFDGSDSVLPGVTLFLDLDEDGRLDEGEPRTVTGRIGTYSFEGLDPGRSYTLAQEQAINTLNTRSTGEDSGRIAHYQW